MRTEPLTVTGMTCGGCVTKVTRALKATAGVAEVKVSLATGEVSVQYDESRATPEQLKLAVTSAGYGVKGMPAAHEVKPKSGCCG